ncbi:hypothetical protein HK104_008252 [Borealophlyctis nickersoniae]|nr:hypothetical protein HK104_008252 [Borealophlyctis nickersoniae]
MPPRRYKQPPPGIGGSSGSSGFPRLANLSFLLTRKWAAAWALVAAFFVAVALFGVFHEQILTALAVFAERIKTWGVWGGLLLAGLLFVTSFPPIPGYGTLLYLCGFVFGFPAGIIPAYLGPLGGGVTCFVVARKWLGEGWRNKIVTAVPSWDIVEKVIEEGGMKLTILIRLAPYPYNLMCVLFSATSISLPAYTLSTAIALLKNSLHVYIGSTIADLAIGASPSSPAKVIALVCSMSVAIGVLIYLTVMVRRVVRARREEEQGLVLGDEIFDEDDDLDGDGDYGTGTLGTPSALWRAATEFGDGTGGAGTPGTPGARVGRTFWDAEEEDSDLELGRAAWPR